jgi:GTP cyclohydrolase I
MYNMTVVVAYIPKQVGEDKYEVIGLSKIPRIVDLCSKRLQLQEKLAQDIAECISLATGSDDVFVNIKGDHACVSARGVKSDGFTDVTYMQGMFRDNPDLRNEIERKIRHI